jgi:pyridoxal phosphate enzyme (YggS family)
VTGSGPPGSGGPRQSGVAAVRARIAAAAARAGRDPGSVLLVGASKTVPVERLRDALRDGLTDLGENRAQELLAKAPELARDASPPRWHFLGRVQRNKVKALADWIVCWQSVDREELGVEIARRAPGARVLVEVDIAGEPQKGGCLPEAAPGLVERLAALGLRVDGLMALPPQGDEPRPWFAAVRELAERIGVRELSMGMSDDYEVAVEEGATIVRVGRALFGPRESDAR